MKKRFEIEWNDYNKTLPFGKKHLVNALIDFLGYKYEWEVTELLCEENQSQSVTGRGD